MADVYDASAERLVKQITLAGFSLRQDEWNRLAMSGLG
jgi:hypothetical protein